MSEIVNGTLPIDSEQLQQLIESEKNLVVIDVRSPEEYLANHIAGAINIPLSQLSDGVADLPKNIRVITVCNFGGQRSCSAAEQLHDAGFEQAQPLRGGMSAWSEKA